MEPHDGHRPADADPGVGPADATGPTPTASPTPAPTPRPTPRPTPAPPVAVPEPATGNATVAAALQELASVGQRPLAEHPDAFARVHSGLQQALSDIDDA